MESNSFVRLDAANGTWTPSCRVARFRRSIGLGRSGQSAGKTQIFRSMYTGASPV